MPKNQLALYPTWLILYGIREIVPMLMLIIAAMKILLKSGKQIQRAFDIQYATTLPDIRGDGTSETLGDTLIQGFMMEQALFHIRPKSGGAIAPPATPLLPEI